MKRIFQYLLAVTLWVAGINGFNHPARAEFIISSAIVEFNSPEETQQDVELASRSKTNDYIVTEVSEVLHPGEKNETRLRKDNPAESGLLVTPDKTILTAGAHKVLRFVLLKAPDDKEHIYRVAIKPVIRGVENNTKVGLKILIGYEVLVIVRPANLLPQYHAQRHGKQFTVSNTGNTNILFQNGQQCKAPATCKLPPVLRVYPGQTVQSELPADAPIEYSVWDGKDTNEKRFD